MKRSKKNPNVVVIGGGTGTFVVLSGLKNYPVNLSAIVTMMDSGGSTGRLRDQLGVLPPGDLRQALVALSESEEIWRSLFTYRFDCGDLDGHSFGNIFLSALEKITSSNQTAISLATEVLKAKGKVFPVTLTHSTLCARFDDNTTIEGESFIDTSGKKGARIRYMYLQPDAEINPQVCDVLKKADFIIFGPGDLYTSVIPNLLVTGVTQAISNSKAKKVFVVNLMTKLGQTDDFKASDFVNEIQKYIGCKMNFIIINSQDPPGELLGWYERSGDACKVEDDIEQKSYPRAKIIREDVLSKAHYEQSLSDRIKRSLIRHDPAKLSKVLVDRVFRL